MGWERLDDDIVLRRSAKGAKDVDDECRYLKEMKTEITNEIERCRAKLDKLTQEIAVGAALSTDQNGMIAEMQTNSNGTQREYYRASRQGSVAESVDQHQISQARRSESDKSANLKNSRTTQSRHKQRVEQPETKKSASTILMHFVMHLSYMIRSIAPDSMIIPVQKFNATLDVVDLFVTKKILNHYLVVEVRMIVTAQSILTG